MQSTVSFVLDGKVVNIDFQRSDSLCPTTTVLQYLRGLPDHKGVKEGCAEGDCGACTCVIGELDGNKKFRYSSIDSCLVFLSMLHGKQLITVENVAAQDSLHPVQQAMVDTGGSQCGYCTPGFIMSLFSLYKNHDHPQRGHIDDALTGNLCRCTGYRPIVEAAANSCIHKGQDHFNEKEPRIKEALQSLDRGSIILQTAEQTYLRPASLGEAVSLLHQHQDAIILSGATDIALRVTKRHETLKKIIDLSGLDELRLCINQPASLEIGAGTNLNDVKDAVQKDFPAMYDMLSVFGSQQIRNLATLGGNLGTASPIGDMLPVLMAYDATIVVEGMNRRREIVIDDFIIGYRKTARRQDELIVSIRLPKPGPGTIIKSYKVSKRKDLDISTISAGFSINLDGKGIVSGIILAYGGMADRVKRASATEQFLIGKPWKRNVVEEAMAFIDRDFTPISDARAGSEMRLIAARNLILKFWFDITQLS